MIYLGCSGWSYTDWEGRFYPEASRDKLSYYAGRFHSVEINSTFYMVPGDRTVESWIAKVSRIPGFRFSVKLPKDLSHDLILRNAEGAGYFAQSFEASVLESLRKNENLGAILLQLPPFFGLKHVENLLKFSSMIDTSRYRYAVEVRNRDLYSNIEIEEKLSENGISYVAIDSPEKHLDSIKALTNWAYLRLHGQNAEEWNNPATHGMDKYLYNYQEMELRGIAARILEAESRYSDLYIYFNNHPQGNAPGNAETLAGMINLPVSGNRHTLLDY